MGRRKKWTDEELAQLNKLYADGMSVGEIAEIYGLSKDRVYELIGDGKEFDEYAVAYDWEKATDAIWKMNFAREWKNACAAMKGRAC